MSAWGHWLPRLEIGALPAWCPFMTEAQAHDLWVEMLSGLTVVAVDGELHGLPMQGGAASAARCAGSRWKGHESADT